MSKNMNMGNRPGKKKMIIAAAMIAVVVILLLLLRGCSNNDSQNPFMPNLAENAIEWDGEQNKKEQVEQGYIEMPYFGYLYVTSEEPYVWLNNPKTNDVYFMYQVLNEDGTEVFSNSDLIEPGKALQVNFFELLEPGEHILTINISALDQNGNACNGSSQMAKLVVEK